MSKNLLSDLKMVVFQEIFENDPNKIFEIKMIILLNRNVVNIHRRIAMFWAEITGPYQVGYFSSAEN